MDRKGNTKLFKKNKMVTPKSMKNLPGLIYGCIHQATTKNKSESSLRRQIPNPYARNVVFLKGKISLFVEQNMDGLCFSNPNESNTSRWCLVIAKKLTHGMSGKITKKNSIQLPNS